MPIIDQTAFRSDLTKEMRPPLVGDLVVGHGTLERLKVPESVLLKPESVNPFMATQWVRLNAITNQPEIKTLDGEIPEFIYDESVTLQSQSGLTVEERAALESWYRERFGGGGNEGGLVATQSPDLDQLTEEIENFIDEHRDELQQSQTQQSMDPFEGILLNQLATETAEQRKRWQELILAARGNPEMVNTIIGMRTAQKVTQRLGRLVQMYSFYVDRREQAVARFDLMNRGGNITTADLARFNAEAGSVQTDLSSVGWMIQTQATELERINTFTSTSNQQIRRPMEVMINNMKT